VPGYLPVQDGNNLLRWLHGRGLLRAGADKLGPGGLEVLGERITSVWSEQCLPSRCRAQLVTDLKRMLADAIQLR
jgi:hypothetical protein